ncbi:MAG: extracellular solute-binding protein [Thermoanaerobaculia bacterium]
MPISGTRGLPWQVLLPSLTLGVTLLTSCSDGRMPVVLYSPHGRDLLELVERAYEARHPEIDVRWLDMGSQEVYDRVRSERANPQADVWFGGPDTILSRGAAEGLLAANRPSWAEHVPPASRHAGDFYFGLYRAVPLLLYNSQAVSDAEAPSDWQDLLDERWRGKVVIRDPLASGTMRTAFGLVLARSVAETGSEEAGLEWLRRLDAQTSDYVQNPALLFEKIIRQEGLVTIWELTDALLLTERGAPVSYRFPTSGTPVIDDAIGLVAGAPHGEAARAFIDWVGSEEALALAAREVFRLPAREDLPEGTLPEWAERALEEIRPAEIDWELLGERGQEWMRRWDREVRSKG